MRNIEQSRLAISVDRELIDRINKIIPWGLRSNVFSKLVSKAVDKLEEKESNLIRFARGSFNIEMEADK